jgi:adenylylsulfate kinase-like enzyme
MVYFITGQPGTGKSTAAEKLYEQLTAIGRKPYRLDGDNVRKMWPFIGYSDTDRAASIARVLTLTTILHAPADGHDVIVSVVAPIAQSRTDFHNTFKGKIMEIRLTAIKEHRPEEYYSTFYEGGPEPHIQGLVEFAELLTKIDREWDVGGLRP